MRIEYISAVLASSVSWWSSCGKEWTKRYRFDASFATLLFSRTTKISLPHVWLQNIPSKFFSKMAKRRTLFQPLYVREIRGKTSGVQRVNIPLAMFAKQRDHRSFGIGHPIRMSLGGNAYGMCVCREDPGD